MHCKGGYCVNWRSIGSGDNHDNAIYFGSNGSNEVDMGDGDDNSIVKEWSGFPIIEVDGIGSTEGQSWSWLKIAVIMLAIKLGLVCSYGLHYFCFTRKIVMKKWLMQNKILRCQAKMISQLLPRSYRYRRCLNFITLLIKGTYIVKFCKFITVE